MQELCCQYVVVFIFIKSCLSFYLLCCISGIVAIFFFIILFFVWNHFVSFEHLIKLPKRETFSFIFIFPFGWFTNCAKPHIHSAWVWIGELLVKKRVCENERERHVKKVVKKRKVIIVLQHQSPTNWDYCYLLVELYIPKWRTTWLWIIRI